MLLALLILTMVATLAAGMVWQQWRAVQIEGAERARTQAAWILSGALDWARLILREDARNNASDQRDHLGEPWAVPLAEARLSSFLAADKDNNSIAENDSLDAFLSGSIVDAQSRWNLRRLVLRDTQGKLKDLELRVLGRLCAAAGAPGDCASRIAAVARSAWDLAAANRDSAVIAPQRLSQFAWLGIDAELLAKLEPFVTVLPVSDTTVNVNTASAEVIAAVVDGMTLGQAQRLVQDRARSALRNVTTAPGNAYFPAEDKFNSKDGVGVSSRFFIVQGRLRLGERVLEERSLVERVDSLNIVVRQRERLNLRDDP
jgi:general secretion pathway protein K